MPKRAGRAPHLSVLQDFELHDGFEPVDVPFMAQRLAAYLALQDRPVARARTAGLLWADLTTARAQANLRTALWRLQQAQRPLIDVTRQRLSLAPGVTVDLRDARRLARRVLDRSTPMTDADLDAAVASKLFMDLLPDWCDEWITVERERFRQLRLHVLEVLCERLADVGRFGEAVDVGLAAVCAEPLRESAHRSLARVHLAEGNHVEAVRQYETCRSLLRDELGLEPSSEFRRLVALQSP